MGEEQIFVNVFDFLDILIAISKRGRKAISELPDSKIVFDKLPEVKNMVEQYDKTSPMQILTRQRIDNEIKEYCKETVVNLQAQKSENIVDAGTVSQPVEKVQPGEKLKAALPKNKNEPQIVNPNKMKIKSS